MQIFPLLLPVLPRSLDLGDLVDYVLSWITCDVFISTYISARVALCGM